MKSHGEYQYILDLPEIRVYVDAGFNFGNQAANVNFIKKLLDDGYKGKITVIYDASRQHVKDLPLKDRIFQLFDIVDIQKNHVFLKPSEIPGTWKAISKEIAEKTFAKIPSPYIEIIPIEDFKKSNPMPIAIGVTAAMDYPFDGPINFSDLLRVRIFVRFYPYPCGNECRYPQNHTYLYSSKGIVAEIPESGHQALVVPVPTLKDAKTYLNSKEGERLRTEKPGLNKLIQRIEDKSIIFQALYGLGLKGPDARIPNFNLINMLLGAAQAQTDLGETRPLVMGIFTSMFKESMDATKKAIFEDDWGVLQDEPGIKNIRKAIQDTSLKKRLQITNINAIDQLEKLKGATKVLLIEMERLPKVVFDGYYFHVGDNIWPQVREGAGAWPLVLSGKPHLRCRDPKQKWDIQTNLLAQKYPILEQFMENTHALVCDLPGDVSQHIYKWRVAPELYKYVSRYLSVAINPASEVAELFKALREQALKPENDRYKVGLIKAALVSPDFANWKENKDKFSEHPQSNTPYEYNGVTVGFDGQWQHDAAPIRQEIADKTTAPKDETQCIVGRPVSNDLNVGDVYTLANFFAGLFSERFRTKTQVNSQIEEFKEARQWFENANENTKSSNDKMTPQKMTQTAEEIYGMPLTQNSRNRNRK